jgi:hypothetical protein
VLSPRLQSAPATVIGTVRHTTSFVRASCVTSTSSQRRRHRTIFKTQPYALVHTRVNSMELQAQNRDDPSRSPHQELLPSISTLATKFVEDVKVSTLVLLCLASIYGGHTCDWRMIADLLPSSLNSVTTRARRLQYSRHSESSGAARLRSEELSQSSRMRSLAILI